MLPLYSHNFSGSLHSEVKFAPLNILTKKKKPQQHSSSIKYHLLKNERLKLITMTVMYVTTIGGHHKFGECGRLPFPTKLLEQDKVLHILNRCQA